MNKSLVAGAFSMLLVVSQNGVAENLDLEPCINGSVSESELFASQCCLSVVSGPADFRLPLRPQIL